MRTSFTTKLNKTEETNTTVKEDDTQKKNRASKLNPLLNSKTDEYVDDFDVYKPRITRAERYQYWIQLKINKKPRKLPDFISWIGKEFANVNELDNFSKRYIFLFAIIKTSFWDHLYINLFIIWWILIVFYNDGWATKYVPIAITLNANNTLLLLPPLFMFISQLIPFFGTIYFINNCNDLVKFLAKTEMGHWGFICVLLAQYFEYFFYSGQGLSHKAGNCRKGSPNSNTMIMVYNFISKRFHKHPKIIPIIENEDNEESNLELNSIEDESSIQDENNSIEREQDREILIPKRNIDASNSNKNATNNTSNSNNNDINNTSNSNKNAINNTNNSKNNDINSKSDNNKINDEKENHDSNNNTNDDNDIENNNNNNVNVITYIDWKCMVCLLDNHEPSKIPQDANISFGEKGIFYKRTYAKINLQRTVPYCKKCFTYYDYIPPKGSAHLFPHNKTPYVAFDKYPIYTEVQAGLKIDSISRYKYRIQSFFYGVRDTAKSLLLRNDWKLRKWISNRFPELPRYILEPNELYQLGEIIECRQQKYDWCRARIVKVHANHTYDIRYDAADEIRFVAHNLIRTIPEKRAYAFRVELGVVVMVVFTPLGAVLSVTTNNYGLIMIGIMIVMILLFSIRLVTFFQYFYNYYDAGFNVIARLSAIYSIPLFFTMLSSIIAVTGGSIPLTWITVTILFILAMFSSLPVLYMLRPPYATIGLITFTQISIGLILTTAYINKLASFQYIAIPLAPFLTTALFIKFIRRSLHTIWDVSLIMHTAKDTSADNPSILKIVWDLFVDCFDG